VVVVPAETFSLPERKRVFYKVVSGDTARDVAALFGVTPDEIYRWNALDPGASLHDGMSLQIFAPPGPVRADVLVLEEKDAHVLPVGSTEFFTHFEALRGRTRVELLAKQGDTWRTVAHRYGLSVAQLERINGRARSTPLHPGDKLVVYAASAKAPPVPLGGTPRPPAAAPRPGKVEERAPDAIAVAKPVEEGAALVRPAPDPSAPDDAAVRDDTGKPPALAVPVGLPVRR
jgi:membrane-bound lytic murein transglycosylase D